MNTPITSFTPKQLYNKLFAGERIQVQCPTKASFHALRAAIHRQHRNNQLLGICELSVCADYDADSCTGTYWLGEKRNGTATQWTVLESGASPSSESEHAQVRSDLAEDQSWR